MIKAIIFDVGDVIIFYNNPKLIKSLQKDHCFDENKFAVVELQNRLKHDLGHITTKQFVANLNKELGTKFTAGEYFGLMHQIVVVNEPLLSLIRQLREKYKIILLSNNSKPWLKYVREHPKMKELFDKIIFSCQHHLKKPDPCFFNLAIRGEKFGFKECLFVDDRQDLIQAAAKLGLRGITYKNVPQLQRELKPILK